ncbi:MAG: YerC/YecD family TrpR-related protein [Clostridia bacterium]|nr:YerC/YecD family TrpR-related protein [Clostridia bacterium]
MINFHTPSIDRLFETFVNLKSIEECYQYFEDLCTVKEIQDMAQRLDAAIMLSEGARYQQIVKEVNISSATVCRVSKCLNYGAGGYKNAIEKLRKDEK